MQTRREFLGSAALAAAQSPASGVMFEGYAVHPTQKTVQEAVLAQPEDGLYWLLMASTSAWCARCRKTMAGPGANPNRSPRKTVRGSHSPAIQHTTAWCASGPGAWDWSTGGQWPGRG